MRKYTIILLIIICSTLFGDFKFAVELFDDGLYEEAINEFQAIVQLYPTSYEAERALYYIGRSYHQMQKYKLAESTYLQLLDGYPQNNFQDEIYAVLADVQYDQTKYSEAKGNYEYLIQNFPLSEFTQNSLFYYLDCFYQLNEFNLVIEKGKQLQQDYSNSKELSEILLIMVKAHLQLNSYQEAETIMDLIQSEFPQENASREIVLLKTDLLVNEGKYIAAEKIIIASLANDLPRYYEELFRFKLASIYMQHNAYNSAADQLIILVEKFNNSSQMDKYLLNLHKAYLGIGEYKQAIKALEDPRVMENSRLYPEFLLIRAEAYFQLQEITEAENLRQQAVILSANEDVIFQALMLNARIMESNERWVQAVKQYLDLTNWELADLDQLWFRIGNIYSDKLGDYNKAIRYYSNIIYGTYPVDVQYQALYLLAICHERLGNYQEAVDALNSIDQDEVSDSEFRTKLRNKLIFLKKFKLQDLDSAVTEMLNSIYSYIDTNNKQELQSSIIDILTNDLKEYDLSNQILTGSDRQEDIYLRALINLKLAEKAGQQNNFEQTRYYLDSALELASQLNASEFEEEIKEISLREQVLTSEDSDLIITKLENYIKQYPASAASNEFLIMIIDHYRENNDSGKLVEYIEQLNLTENIDSQDYYKYKIWLAEYYYQQDADEKASENFRLASAYLDLNQPQSLFHYAVTLDQTGKQQEAADKLEFLINNSEGFQDYNVAVNYYVDLLINNEQYQKAAKFYSYIAKADRDDAYYRKSSEIYLALSDKQAAKEALMNIVEKDNSTLEKLAYLQYETADLEMAKYSFNLLKDRDSGNLDHYKMLGRIAFEQEAYLESAENYKVVVDALGEKEPVEPEWKQIARENIIALYHIGNRPKAETLLKRFNKNLDQSDKNEIELHEGIYYLDIDAKKAEKTFNKLTKSGEVDNSIRYKAYFWRGVSHLKQEEMDAAEADFLVVLESGEQNLINQANLKLGTLNFSRENYEQSLQHYFEVIENDESGELALDAAKNFAFVCKTIEEWQKAVAAYEIILARWGDTGLEANTLFDIAFCHFRDKRYPDALEMFRQALPLLTERELAAESQYWIGEALFNMADYDKAIAEFLKVSYNYNDLVHWSATAELKAGEAYTKADQPDKAIRIYERIISKYGEISQWGKEAQFRISSLNQGN